MNQFRGEHGGDSTERFNDDTSSDVVRPYRLNSGAATNSLGGRNAPTTDVGALRASLYSPQHHTVNLNSDISHLLFARALARSDSLNGGGAPRLRSIVDVGRRVVHTSDADNFNLFRGDQQQMLQSAIVQEAYRNQQLRLSTQAARTQEGPPASNKKPPLPQQISATNIRNSRLEAPGDDVLHANHVSSTAVAMMSAAAASSSSPVSLKRSGIIVPCRSRGMPADHNTKTAYFVLHQQQLRHGDGLLCSHPQCQRRGIRFLYCAFCEEPVAKANFATRHSHDKKEQEIVVGRGGTKRNSPIGTFLQDCNDAYSTRHQDYSAEQHHNNSEYYAAAARRPSSGGLLLADFLRHQSLKNKNHALPHGRGGSVRTDGRLSEGQLRGLHPTSEQEVSSVRSQQSVSLPSTLSFLQLLNKRTTTSNDNNGGTNFSSQQQYRHDNRDNSVVASVGNSGPGLKRKQEHLEDLVHGGRNTATSNVTKRSRRPRHERGGLQDNKNRKKEVGINGTPEQENEVPETSCAIASSSASSSGSSAETGSSGRKTPLYHEDETTIREQKWMSLLYDRPLTSDKSGMEVWLRRVVETSEPSSPVQTTNGGNRKSARTTPTA